MRHLIPLLILLFTLPIQADTVILIHGLGRTHRSMIPMANALSDEFTCIRVAYPSRHLDIPTIAKKILHPIIQDLPPTPVHFVTHSLGGIIVRAYLNEYPLANLGKVVMLAPPNQGSELVPFLSRFWPISSLMGPAFIQLGPEPASWVNQLPRPQYPIGIISGSKSWNPLFSAIIPGPDDGKVSVKSTQMDPQHGHLHRHVSHSFLMNDPDVIRQTRHFLKTGHFQVRQEAAPKGARQN
ncbi:MAG: hypothetical protein CL521_01555 [Actinobacteria bacterium]|nr:hypothetical protein [Actinomycetota bacterium]